MDAVIAAVYRLDRDDYAHILRSFRHKSFSHAAEYCLAAFDDLARTGLQAFCRMHDPYSDIPLATACAQPMLDLSAVSVGQRSLHLAKARSS